MTVTDEMQSISASELFVSSAFYTNLKESQRNGDRFVLIRMPADVKVEEFMGCPLSFPKESDETSVLGTISVKKRKKNAIVSLKNTFTFTHTTEDNQVVEESVQNYTLKRNPLESQVSSLALATPITTVTANNQEDIEMAVNILKFDESWTLHADNTKPVIDFEYIKEKVAVQAGLPLVAQPKGLRMRVSAVSMPPAKKLKKTKKERKNE